MYTKTHQNLLLTEVQSFFNYAAKFYSTIEKGNKLNFCFIKVLKVRLFQGRNFFKRIDNYIFEVCKERTILKCSLLHFIFEQ